MAAAMSKTGGGLRNLPTAWKGFAVALLVVTVVGTGSGAKAEDGSGSVNTSAPIGEPVSIVLVIVDGTEQDFAHAELPPGSSLTLAAKIGDANGNIIQSTPEHPCTVGYKLGSTSGADGVARARLDGNVLHFGPGQGAFTVSAFCVENPGINSLVSNEELFNFKTTDGNVAKEPHRGSGTGGSSWSRNEKLLIAAVLVGLAAIIVVAVATRGSAGVGCQCRCNNGTVCTTQTGCQATGTPNDFCGCPSGNGCDGRGGQSARTISTVEELVASGFQRSHAAAAPPRSHADKHTTDAPNARRWLGPAITTAALAATLTSIWLSKRSSSIELTPWINVDGGGVGVTARF